MADGSGGLPPIRGALYVFDTSLVSQADTRLIQANPTLAAGDVVRSIDGAVSGNMDTLPTVTPAAGRGVQVKCSVAEMTCARLRITFTDAADAQWCSQTHTIEPQAWATVVAPGTAQAVAADTITLPTGTPAASYVGCAVLVTAATLGAGQARRIVSQAGLVCTLSHSWDTQPTGTVTCTVLAESAAAAAVITLGAAGAGLTALGDTRLANLDALVSTRSTYDGGAVAGVAGDVTGKLLGVGSGTITGVGAWAAGADGAALALASAVTALPAAVWDRLTTALTTAGSIGKALADLLAVFNADTRTLTQTSTQIAAALDGGDITVQRGDTVVISVTGLGDITNRTKLWVTAKFGKSDADSAAIFQITEAGGLLILNGASAGTTTDASISVTNQATGALTITLKPAITDDLSPGAGWYADIQVLRSTGAVDTLATYDLAVTADVTRSVA